MTTESTFRKRCSTVARRRYENRLILSVRQRPIEFSVVPKNVRKFHIRHTWSNKLCRSEGVESDNTTLGSRNYSDWRAIFWWIPADTRGFSRRRVRRSPFSPYPSFSLYCCCSSAADVYSAASRDRLMAAYYRPLVAAAKQAHLFVVVPHSNHMLLDNRARQDLKNMLPYFELLNWNMLLIINHL